MFAKMYFPGRREGCVRAGDPAIYLILRGMSGKNGGYRCDLWEDPGWSRAFHCPENGPGGTPLKGKYFRGYRAYFSDCGDIAGIFPGSGQGG